LAYCSNCGEKTSNDANFCPKCGAKTEKGKAAKVTYPSDELRDAFYNVGIELERAFTIAARETHAAIKRASENMQQKSAGRGSIVCPMCGTKNTEGSFFCHKCGAEIAPKKGSQSNV